MSQDLIKDILLQIQEQQMKDAATLGEIRGDLKSHNERVNKLEAAQTRNWWLALAIGPALAIAHGFARKFGVDI